MSETVTIEQDVTTLYRNIQDGLTIDFGDGKTLVIPPHSQRVYLEVWSNGFIDVLFYQEPQEDEDPSDRIHLMVHDFDGGVRGHIMNVEDAICIVHGLTTAIQHAIGAGVPTKPLPAAAPGTEGGVI